MPLLNKERFPRLVSVALIVALLSVGFTTRKHLVSSGKSQWTTLDREMRRVGYHAERLNLRSAVIAEENAPLRDFAWQVFNISAAQNAIIPSRLVFSARQRDGEHKNDLRNQSPVLNL